MYLSIYDALYPSLLFADLSLLPIITVEAKDGRAFFKSKYGAVDGNEVQRVAELRAWKQKGRNYAEICFAHSLPPRSLPLCFCLLI